LRPDGVQSATAFRINAGLAEVNRVSRAIGKAEELIKKLSHLRRTQKVDRVTARKFYRILVEVGPHESLRNLHHFRLDHCCMPQRSIDDAGVRRLHAYASGATIVALRKAGRKVKVLADANAEGKILRRFVGKGDRFEGGQRGPAGVGKLV
jgi:hypothetical protein